MRVGPSKNKQVWQKFFWGSPQWTPQEFRRLIDDDEPGAAAFEIETFINGSYRAQALGTGRPDTQFRAEWVSVNGRHLYDRLGVKRRDVHLGLLRWMKRASCLSPVLGAGVTMAAGGPSWPALVRKLLDIALTRGHELSRMVEQPGSTEESRRFRREVYDARRFDGEQATKAKGILKKIDAGSATVEHLKDGAQLCYDLFGQHLYTHITGILYEGDRAPSPIHEAIAELAVPQQVPDRGGIYPGWSDIVTYNFDDFMGLALDARGIARVAWAMRGDELAGDPNEAAQREGQDGTYQSIYHLHGYTPRRLFRLTHVRFVFATSEYADTYEGRQVPIFVSINQRVLSQPVIVALYVGCSFDDERMNELLENASGQYPGRFHYALMKWPGKSTYGEATRDELDEHEAKAHLMGIRPVWFDDFREIPDLIRTIGGPQGEPLSYTSAYGRTS